MGNRAAAAVINFSLWPSTRLISTVHTVSFPKKQYCRHWPCCERQIVIRSTKRVNKQTTSIAELYTLRTTIHSVLPSPSSLCSSRRDMPLRGAVLTVVGVQYVHEWLFRATKLAAKIIIRNNYFRTWCGACWLFLLESTVPLCFAFERPTRMTLKEGLVPFSHVTPIPFNSM